ncbi:MAG: hypothetical protein AB7K24_23140 [Gemmataceae bacterium]
MSTGENRAPEGLLSRRAFVASSLGVVAATGCNNWPTLRQSNPFSGQAQVPQAVPTGAELASYLNQNSKRIQSLEVRELNMDASQRLQTIGLQGQMICQKPRNFRLSARMGGNTMVDLGSNNEEFWYWIAKSEPPYLFHCSYNDLPRVPPERMPFPFQPEWVMETLGLAELDPSKNYQVITKPQSFELIEQTRSAQGQPVRKVTVFSRAPSSVQVTSHSLQDAQGKEMCAAYVTDVQVDAASGAVIPRMVQLVWPAEKIKLKLRLNEIVVNQALAPERTARLFSKPVLKDVRDYDLAQGTARPTGNIRQMGGPTRTYR